MDILFNKVAENFQKEFKECLGFVDADFPYKKIRADIRSATSSLVKIIGLNTYEEIVTLYTTNKDDNELLILAQYAVAIEAYRTYAPVNDLQHGTNGRKMLTDEHSKTPFEHMLMSSDDELERRQFKAMDALIDFLDAKSETWKASEEYKNSHNLLVRSVADFSNFFVIESRYLLMKLQPALSKAEREIILPRVTKATIKVVKAKVFGTNTEALTETEITLISLIKEACVYSAMAWGVIRLQATLFPSGLYQQLRGDRTTIKGRMPVTGNQADQLEQKFQEDAEKALLAIEKLLTPVVADTTEETEATEVSPEFDDDENFVST